MELTILIICSIFGKMHGEYRMPTMLKLVDQLSRIF